MGYVSFREGSGKGLWYFIETSFYIRLITVFALTVHIQILKKVDK